jgi:hypothetical protein
MAVGGEETVDRGGGTIAVVEVRQRADLPQHYRSKQQRDGLCTIDVSKLGDGLRAIEDGVEWLGVLLGDPPARTSRSAWRAHRQWKSAHASTNAVNLSASEPFAGGVGAGGIRE